MQNLPLNALRAFASVYEQGGVRPAARALDITHSSVSRHLRELEAWLGVDLLDKTPQRRLSFTAAGEALGKAALSSLRDLETSVAAIREQRQGNSITIETTPSVATRWLLPRMPALEAAYPWIEISVVVEQKLRSLSEGSVDFSIRMGQGPWPGFRCDSLMDDALYPVVGRDLWRSFEKSLSRGDGKGLRLIHDRDPHASWQLWQRHYPLENINLRAGPRFASSDLVLRAAAQNQGMALARGRLARDDIASGALIRPFGDRQIALPDAYWVLQSPGAPERFAVSETIKWLKTEAVG